MRSKMSLFAFLLIAGSLALPLAAHAGGIPFFGPIIPQEGIQAVCPAGWGMLIEVINNLISFFITLAIVFVAPLMFAYAGFLFVTNPVNASGKEKAKKVLWNTVIGIGIALAAWMIVDAIMVVLYNPDAKAGTTKLDAWSSLISSKGAPLCLSQKGANKDDTLNQATPHAPLNVVYDDTDEQTIRQRFANSGVSINKSPCPANTKYQNVEGGCTNVDGMREATIAQVIFLATACGSKCAVTITGGTELGHAAGQNSHENGWKVDLLPTDKLNKYIESFGTKNTRAGDGSGGPLYLDICNNEYVRESNPDHWDITIYNSGRNCLL